MGDHCFLGIKEGDIWIFGEPLLKSFFTEVNLKTQEITFSEVVKLHTELLSPLKTDEGWVVMISLAVGSLATYIFAFCIYVKYEECKKRRAKENNAGFNRPKSRML